LTALEAHNCYKLLYQNLIMDVLLTIKNSFDCHLLSKALCDETKISAGGNVRTFKGKSEVFYHKTPKAPQKESNNCDLLCEALWSKL
jgi:hypothetical protein